MLLLRSQVGAITTTTTSIHHHQAQPIYKPGQNIIRVGSKPKICTADELHYVPLSNSDWNLALWRYLPSPKAPNRNHPLLLLSGVGANAIGYDLSPEASFARFMSMQGFDTWIVELRGSGLSVHGLLQVEEGEQVEESGPTTKFSDNFIKLSDRFVGFLNEGPLEVGKMFTISNQIKDLSERIANTIDGLSSYTPPFFNLQDRISTTLEDFQKQFQQATIFDWDFDSYLEEDVPAAMDHIRTHSQPKDGKLLAIGHSMGGILLYAMLSRCCVNGLDSGLASVTTLASSLNYTSSKSALKTILPLADPIQALNVSTFPIGALLAAAHPFASRPPYVLSWWNLLISSSGMLHPELFEKLVLNGFGSVPSKVLLQLMTVFQERGLCDRGRTLFYKDHISKSNVPILALAADHDLICPPEAVYDTVKLIPDNLITYKVFGEPTGPHYAHYDLVGGQMATDNVYPCILDFLKQHDRK
ncbi:hypothetical protein ACFE04_007529 [Oxalis oulophora]